VLRFHASRDTFAPDSNLRQDVPRLLTGDTTNDHIAGGAVTGDNRRPRR
jgi:hypothetical protein